MVSVGLQMICMGAAGAPATCVDVAMQSATGAIVSVTETFSAVRTRNAGGGFAHRRYIDGSRDWGGVCGALGYSLILLCQCASRSRRIQNVHVLHLDVRDLA